MVLTSFLFLKTRWNTPPVRDAAARVARVPSAASFLAASFVAAALAHPTPALADEPAPLPPGAPVAAAPPGARPASAPAASPAALPPDALFQLAGKAYDAGDYRAAHLLYTQVFQKKKTHDVAAMLAQTEMKLDRPCDAAAHLALAVESFPPSLPPEHRARVRRAQADVAKRIGSLRVAALPGDAAVRVDFAAVPPASLPGPFCVPAGDRVVFIERGGFAAERRAVTVEPTATVELTVSLRLLSKEPTGTDPPTRPGPIAPHLPSPPLVDPGTPLVLTLLSAGVGGLVAGAIVLPLAQLKHDEANRLARDISGAGGACSLPTDFEPECRRLQSLRADASSFGNAGLASLVTGAVLGAAGGGLLLLRPPIGGAGPGGPRVTIGAAPDGVRAALTGFF